MFKLEWFNFRQEVYEVNSGLQYNCYYLVKNNLRRNFYNQILLNCKFFIANYTYKYRQVFSEVNSSTYSKVSIMIPGRSRLLEFEKK